MQLSLFDMDLHWASESICQHGNGILFGCRMLGVGKLMLDLDACSQFDRWTDFCNIDFHIRVMQRMIAVRHEKRQNARAC